MDPENRLVHDIYATVLDDTPWNGVVEQAASLLGATSAMLFTPFLAPDAGGFLISHHMPKTETERYLTEVAEVDVWYQSLLRRHGQLDAGFTYRTRALLPDSELKRSRLYADYLVACDIGQCMGTVVGDGKSADTPVATFTVYRPFGSRDFTDAQDACLRRIQRHLAQALLVRRRLHAADDSCSAMAIGRVATAVVVLSRERRLLLANPAAERLFAAVRPSLVRDGQLVAVGACQAQALAKALAACCSYRFDAGFSLSIRLSGTPGSGVVIRLAPPPAHGAMSARAAAIGFLVQEGRAPLDPRTMLAVLYRLTPAECALAMALFEGATPESFGAQRQVAQSTVKTQLRSVFDKTGVHRQSDLMRLMMSVAH